MYEVSFVSNRNLDRQYDMREILSGNQTYRREKWNNIKWRNI